jgi:AP-4 complex subunit mu-1
MYDIVNSALYIVATSRFNVSPSYLLEFLNRIYVIIKDFLGIVTEEMVRKNFVLVYEILGTSWKDLDEIIDFGQPQLTSTELIKPLIVNELIQNKESLLSVGRLGGTFSLFSSDTISSNASQVAVGRNR